MVAERKNEDVGSIVVVEPAPHSEECCYVNVVSAADFPPAVENRVCIGTLFTASGVSKIVSTRSIFANRS